jgi:hypothetical protein
MNHASRVHHAYRSNVILPQRFLIAMKSHVRWLCLVSILQREWVPGKKLGCTYHRSNSTKSGAGHRPDTSNVRNGIFRHTDHML